MSKSGRPDFDWRRRLRPSTIVEFKAQMRFLPIAMRMTLMAAPITPAGRYSRLGPLGMTRLPHSFPETVRNRGYGTVDRNSQIIIKHDCDLVLVNFH
jgi:hypothetical protein